MELRHTVNLDDLDFMGIVSHYQWLLLMERLRTSVMQTAFHKMLTNGLGFVISDVNLQYKRPARYLQKLKMTLELVSQTGARYTLRHTFLNEEGKPLVIGDITIVSVDANNKPTNLPEEYKQEMEACLASLT